MKILVLTDTADYGPQATLYPLLKALCARPEVEGVYIADKAIAQNALFFNARDPGISYIYVRRADTAYTFETQHLYAPLLFPLEQADAVWMRLDLADELFLQFVHALWPDRFISNAPAGMIRSGTKAFLLGLVPVMGDLMPPIKLCYSASNVAVFRRRNPNAVLKVLRSFGGQGVVRIRNEGESDLNGSAEIEAFLKENGPALAMRYLNNPNQSDNRICVLNGEILGVVRRVPKPGDWICNLMAGGSFDVCEPDAREIEIVARLHPIMRELGVHYYGVDTLLDEENRRVLSEVNTINAGGAYRFEQKTGRPVCRMIADAFVEEALVSRLQTACPAQ